MTVEQISELLAASNREGKAVVVTGGGTLSGMGRPPARSDVTLSTLTLDTIVEDAPSDLTIAVQSGVRIRTLAQRLQKHGTHVPFDAPHPADATVGGTLAAGWLGPRRHLYGRPRDFVIGSVAVLADGTIARAGGMVVKNVAGYDMSRLYVGSFGTLAVIAQINLKTAAAPDVTRGFQMRLPEGTRARALDLLTGLTVTPAAAFWIDGFKTAVDGEDGAEGRLFVLLEGSESVVDRGTRDLRAAMGRAGVPETRIVDAGARESFERIVDAYIACVGERSITYRIPAFTDDAISRVHGMRAIAARFELRTDALIDVMNGDIIFRVSDLDAHALGAKIEMFDDALHDEEPQALVIAGQHPSRALLAVWGCDTDGIDQMRALKEKFDPNRILNPGRFLAGI
ncbi:MAG: FAD-binding oxidoreductase [Candidatus Eremiobacteraeota bacterium]|nr:FAD-binding oxidoreductase [Candidatus Eremiobacteraeota bacterium]